MQGLVTVFGGSGFVGGQVVRALAKAGHRVRVAVRQPNLAYKMRMLGDVGQIEVVQANVPPNAIAEMGRAFIGNYVIPFEVASVLLVVALIGAIIVAREREA